MSRNVRNAVLAASASLALALPAQAGDFSEWELRLGAFVHDPASPERGSLDANVEVILNPFGRTDAGSILIPRIHVGATANFAGRTSVAYAGFVWTYNFAGRWFVEGALGGAVHNGDTSVARTPDRNEMGCRFAFHESASLGYRLTESLSIMTTLEHVSNAGLCFANRGLTNAGVRLGYSF